MSVLIESSGEQLTDNDIGEFERDIGYAMPPRYRAFLLRYNAAKFPPPRLDSPDGWQLGLYTEPQPPLTAAEAWVNPDGFWDLQLMHGLLRDPRRYGDLRNIYRVMREWNHPGELLPIASQCSNGKYFLCLDGPRKNSILIAGERYLGKYNDDEIITPDDYHMIAESFDDLIARLEWRKSE
ncbi:SMI1/KNR4 family protein [Bradyrhizobium sp. LHD-71]|uniref:SMI1/KNR4 family protein n=1 Tax=Bradyrhizobium sp. LHD-71 TaxID=3072141 RepID=UPI00280C8F54|nr:SMI1/KNR4 family protein [Bradyrhizobium sp. LHD-71]MDQ8726498.1 SMI1/KNR4 family protein [Bradyrhizobium sp. LHD-71]